MRLAPYLRELDRMVFSYLGGHEYAAIADSKHEVFILPLNHPTVEELADTVTHEAVHRVHPTWKNGEYENGSRNFDRVRRKATELMQSPKWVTAVYRRLSIELLRLTKAATAQGRF